MVSASRASLSAASAPARSRFAASCRSASRESSESSASTSALSCSYSSCAATARSCASSRAAASRSDLGLGGRGRKQGRVDLAAQPGQSFTAVGDGARHVLEPAFLDGELALQFGAVLDGVLEGPFRRLESGLQLRLLLTDTGGLALHVLRITAAPLLKQAAPSRS
ncbi:predicted protein [Streptomyces pristinaespiralis ATCC 25486]|uniref:Predicted protein n=1 Tax=Streptomyces pristinaespiralis (strain ATCC 25486 / DSM 40338 / CBS 914.69 / JCM 4507 / KCC S-0507 / NBRC 13074 / NRRL 2958 / 5647) TaxID=457429 RepID=D6X5P4_STRE2|nr:predicted protein [Streptomyces pristinaespiralis ATCC 25486]